MPTCRIASWVSSDARSLKPPKKAFLVGGRRKTMRLDTLADQPWAPQRSADKSDAVGCNFQPSPGGRIWQVNSTPDVDVEGPGTGVQVRMFASICDVPVAIEVSDLPLAEVALEVCRGVPSCCGAVVSRRDTNRLYGGQ